VTTYTDRTYAGRLRMRLRDSYDQKMEQLLQAKDFPDYRERVGYLRALKDVTAIMEEVNQELTGA
jgi:hypothetical protein